MEFIAPFPSLYLAKWGFLALLFVGMLVYGWWYKRWLHRIALTHSYVEQSRLLHQQLRIRHMQWVGTLFLALSLTIWVDYHHMSLPESKERHPESTAATIAETAVKEPVTTDRNDVTTSASQNGTIPNVELQTPDSELTPPRLDDLSDDDILSLFQPTSLSLEASDGLDQLKSDVEQLLVATYILRHCHMISVGEDTTIHQRLYAYLTSQKQAIEAFGTNVDVLADNIAVAALGTFQLRYQGRPCDTQQLPSLTRQMENWLKKTEIIVKNP